MNRDARVVSTLLELTDNLVDDYDVIDVLTVVSERCVELLDVAAACVTIAPDHDALHTVAVSSSAPTSDDILRLQAGEGPSLECYRSGRALTNVVLRRDDPRWPSFSSRALDLGFAMIHCLPLRLRGSNVGTLNLFATSDVAMDVTTLNVARGLADIATIAILQHRATLDASVLADRLSYALNSRITIEKAKGMVSQFVDCALDEAFDIVHEFAKRNSLRLTDVATSLVSRTLPLSALDASARS